MEEKNTKNTRINLTEAETKNIASKLRALKETAQMYGVPMFASVVISNDESNTGYLRAVNSAQSHAVFLTNDEIRRHMLVANGFDVTPPRNVTAIDAEDEIMKF